MLTLSIAAQLWCVLLSGVSLGTSALSLIHEALRTGTVVKSPRIGLCISGTSLHRACYYGGFAAAQQLLLAGASCDIADHQVSGAGPLPIVQIPTPCGRVCASSQAEPPNVMLCRAAHPWTSFPRSCGLAGRGSTVLPALSCSAGALGRTTNSAPAPRTSMKCQCASMP